MRAVVISDSHGDSATVNMILSRHRTADMVIFLGDGERDIYTQSNSLLLKDKSLVAVSGNCDFASALSAEEVVSLGGKKIYCLHGHTMGVKHGYERLEHSAELKGVDIVVHGHTHQERTEFKNGIYYMCPGSARAGVYGIIDIDDRTNGVLCYINYLYK